MSITKKPKTSVVAVTPATRTTNSDKYADAINDAHAQAQACAQSAIEHAIRCGELLIAQKRRLKHGEFQDWVRDHCTFSHDTANVYMRATRKKTRGLVFSSLAALLAYERTEKSPKRAGYFIDEQLSIDDLRLPEGHDPKDWAYARQAAKLLARIALHIRYADPLRVARGALRDEYDAIDASARVIHGFVAELRNGISYARSGKPIISMNDLPFAEQQKAYHYVDAVTEESSAAPATIAEA